MAHLGFTVALYWFPTVSLAADGCEVRPVQSQLGVTLLLVRTGDMLRPDQTSPEPQSLQSCMYSCGPLIQHAPRVSLVRQHMAF